MKTEHQIVYGILNALTESEHNNDERRDERFIKDVVLKYRADIIRKHYKNGISVNDEVFQTVPLKLLSMSRFEYTSSYPKIIRMENHSGFYLQKNGMDIPILESEAYSLSKLNYHSNQKPRAKTDGYRIMLYVGTLEQRNFEENSWVYQMIMSFLSEISRPVLGQHGSPGAKVVTVDLKAVLYDPSDCPDYDWERDIFPFPAERTRELVEQILYKEFGFPQKAKSDEVQNTRGDSIRYHENNRVSGTGAEME